MDRISIRCDNQHRPSEVVAFVRRSEDEAVAKALDAPVERTQAELARARAKAGVWVLDNEARRGRAKAHAVGPQEPQRRPTPRIRDGKVYLPCVRCGYNPLPDGIRVDVLQGPLNQAAEAGVSVLPLARLAAYVRTQGHP